MKKKGNKGDNILKPSRVKTTEREKENEKPRSFSFLQAKFEKLSKNERKDYFHYA